MSPRELGAAIYLARAAQRRVHAAHDLEQARRAFARYGEPLSADDADWQLDKAIESFRSFRSLLDEAIKLEKCASELGGAE